MSDSKKKMQAAWAVLLLLWGAFPAISAGVSGSGTGSSSPSSDPASDPAEEPSSDPATDPENIPETDPSFVPDPDPGGTGENSEYIYDPRQGTPEGSEGGVPVDDPAILPEDVPNPMENPYGNQNNDQPLPDALEGMPDPAEWRSWMPDPQTLADKLATGAMVQVSILAPTGISYETAVSAGTLVAAGALVAGDGPLPVGDAAAAGLVGPGWLMNHGIDASSIPGVELPETEPAEESEPEPDQTSEADTSDPIVTGGEINDSTSTTQTEQSYTPASGGASVPDYDDSTASTDNTETNDSTGTDDEQSYTPDSGGAAGWPV